MVGFELEVISKKVDRFGWDRDRNTPSHDRQMLDWMDSLQDFELGEVQAACKQAIIDRPNKCPNEGHIRDIIMKRRGAVMKAIPKPQPHEEPRTPPTDAQKARATDMVAQFAKAKRMK